MAQTFHSKTFQCSTSSVPLSRCLLAVFCVLFDRAPPLGMGFHSSYTFWCSLSASDSTPHTRQNACCMSERGEDKSGFTNKSFFNKKVERLISVLCVCKRGEIEMDRKEDIDNKPEPAERTAVAACGMGVKNQRGKKTKALDNNSHCNNFEFIVS